MNKLRLKFDNGIYISSDITSYLKSFFDIKNSNIDLNKNILEIEYDNEININILYKSIKLYINNDNILLEFNKYNFNIKEDIFVLDNVCCEYCLRSLIENLLLNDKINSCKVISTEDEYINVKLSISYIENIDREDIIKLLNNLNNNEN